MPRILMIGSEAAPFVKTGGLADVLGSLPGALARLGEEVAVVLPEYSAAEITGAVRIWNTMPLSVGPHRFTVAIDQLIHEGVRYLFVDCPPLFGRPGIYNERGADYPDNHIRFALLNQAAIGIARNIFRTDVFHGHDWPAGLVAPYLRANLAGDPTFYGARSVLTIHNLGYQGNFPGPVLGDLGIDRSQFHPAGLELHGQVSFLKAGIVWSDAITTVSPTYAREIQTPEYGYGLDGLLLSRADKITGILNGVDYEEWNPETDPYLRAPYSASDLSGKRFQKLALLKEMGLPFQEARDASRPLIGIISRFAGQKGFDLLGSIAGELAAENVTLVALGSGESNIEQMFRSMAQNWPEKIAVEIGYDNALAHRIEAGADMLLMPSRYEPCGLGQIHSLRYGTVPIVRSTGGLEDTVDDETGFKFREYSPEALLGAVRSALAAWEDQQAWQARMRRGMAKDFSWDAAAKSYQRLYRSLV
jgi:starch synthase